MTSPVQREPTVRFVRRTRPKQRPRIGILIANLADEYQSIILQGARETARVRGAHLLCFSGGSLGSTERRVADQNRIYDLISEVNVDALAVVVGSIGIDCGPERLAEFCKRFRDLPLCTIAGQLPGATSIAVNNQAGVHDAVTHLVEAHGRRRVAFIRGPETNQEAEARFEGYKRALADHDIAFDLRLVAAGAFSAESGARAVELLFDERRLGGWVDALVAADDVTAMGAMDALQARKIVVPAQVAVVGFDDMEEARHCSQPLTTVRQPIRDQGAAAVRVLLERLEGSDDDLEVLLPTTTVLRRSCGCYPGEFSPRDSRAPGSRGSFEAELIRRRQVLTAELSRVAQGSFVAVPGWNDLLIKSFTDQVQTQSDRFSKAFRGLLSSLLESGTEVSAVHDVITVLRRQMLGCLGPDPELRARAEDIFQEVRLITSEAMERLQASRRAKAERLACVVATTCRELALVGSVAELRGVVSRRFSELGIQSCYVSRFDGAPGPDRRAFPIVAHDTEVQHPEAVEPWFPAAQLAPDTWLGVDRSRGYVISTVHFDGKAIGVMAVSLEAPSYFYDVLRDMIGMAIERIERLNPQSDSSTEETTP